MRAVSQISRLHAGTEQIVRWPRASTGRSGRSPTRVSLGWIPQSIEIRVVLWTLACGAGLGAAGGFGTIAAVRGTSGLIVEAVVFITSPILLGLFPTQLSQPAAQATLAIGAMLLYSVYAFLVFDHRRQRIRLVTLTAIVIVHGACLVAWVGLILKSTIGAF